jgi:hypothetical protein
MNSSWLGLLEMFIVLGFVLGLAVLELVVLHGDKRRKEKAKRAGHHGGKHKPR